MKNDGKRGARLAPLSPLSCALRASARRDAVLALPSRLGLQFRAAISRPDDRFGPSSPRLRRDCAAFSGLQTDQCG